MVRPSAALHYALCRCDAPRENKPFCDCSHNKVSFGAISESVLKESEPLAVRDSQIVATLQPNDHLKLDGK